MENLNNSLSLKKISPQEGSSRVPRICNKVDLPEPEVPKMARESPGKISRQIFLRMVIFSFPE